METILRKSLPLLLLVAALSLSATLALHVHESAEEDAARQLQITADRIAARIRERLQLHALILRGAAGLFNASDRVTRVEWQSYVNALRASDSVAGIQGIGYAQFVPAASLERDVARLRASGNPGFRVWPSGKRDSYSAIVFLEPAVGRNLWAIGYDMLSEPVRRTAMESARDTGEPVISGKVRLVQEDGTREQAGSLMYFPVYRRDAPVSTVDERRAALLGWSYSPYRTTDLFSDMLREWVAAADSAIDIHIYDGTSVNSDTLLFDSAPDIALRKGSHRTELRTIETYGHTWLLAVNSPREDSHAAVWEIMALGTLASLLLFALVRSLQIREARASEIANELTQNLRRHEQTLAETENRWRSAIEGSGLGVWDWNVPRGTVYYSKYWKEMLGYSEEEIGSGILEWESRVHPDDKAATLALVEDCLQGRTDRYVSEHRVRCRDGTYRWVLDRGRVFERSPDGKPVRMVGTHSDIDARKMAEIRVRETSTEAQRLRNALDGVSAYVYIKDTQSRYLYCNQPTLELFGVSASELPGTNDDRYFPHETAERLRAIDRRVFAGENTAEEIDLVDASGHRRVYWEVKTPIRDETGQQEIVGLCGISTDITERKVMQETLDRRRAELTAAQRIARLGIWTLDVATNRVEWSSEIYRMLGVDTSVGAPDYPDLEKLFEPESWKRLSVALERARTTGEPYEMELETTRTDGTHGWMIVRGEARRDNSGSITQLHGVALDITERRLSENRVRNLSRLYAAMSECNAAIIRCRTENELFREICRIAVEQGHMKMAWIGLVDNQTRAIVPVCSHGIGTEYLDGISISVSDNPLGQGPTGTATRENHPVWFEDFANDPRTAPWHERGARYGWRASAALPIRRRGTPCGALTFYAGDSGAFDDEIRRLLEEMASQISFALDKFVSEAEAEAYEASLQEAEQRFRSLVEQSIAGAFILVDGRLHYANPRFAEIHGVASGDSLTGKSIEDLTSEPDRRNVAAEIRDLIEGRTDVAMIRYAALRADGTSTDVGVSASRALYRQRPAVIGLMQDLSDRKVAEERIREYASRLERTFMQTVELATTLSEMRDAYTAGHERRVADLAVAIGRELGLGESRLQGLRVGGFLHDVGKTAIPIEILAKPGRISAAEYELIKLHPEAGYDVLKGVDFPWPVADIALQHHERLDGSGYPRGLKGSEIILEARIVAVADVVESMATHRPYRPALGLDRALEEIEKGRGTLFDPDVADACTRLFREKGYALPG